MKLAGWMIAGSVSSAFLLTLAPGLQATWEIWLGMIGPLVLASGSWIATERTFRRQPESLTSVQIGLFVGKMVVVGVYVFAILGGSSLRPVPFVVSFAGYFLVLYAAEAMALHRLLQPQRLSNNPLNDK